MPGDEHISPRAAIQSWLQDTKAHTELAGREKRPTSLRPSGGLKHQSRRPNDRHVRGRKIPESGSRPSQEIINSNSRSNRKLDPFGTDLYSRQHGSDSGNLASVERSGLHVPVQSFKDLDDQRHVDLTLSDRALKRRCRRPSTESYLEPAQYNGIEERQIRTHHSPKKAELSESTNQGHSVEPEVGILPTAPALEKSDGVYKRRQRHKTRADRYDLKDQSKAKRRRSTKKEGSEKQHKSHRRREKSGAAILHDFAAHNVSQDRLTLQPTKSLGFLRKGRASSPVRRRGVPDLAFSEMTFLNSRRSKPEEAPQSKGKQSQNRRNRQRSTKAADTEAEMSRFFTQAQPAAESIVRDCSHKKSRSNGQTRTGSHCSTPALVDLPHTPFLGFGSCGASSLSPVRPLSSAALRSLEQQLSKSPTRSTSYFTWSESAVTAGNVPHTRKDQSPPLETKGSSCRSMRSVKSSASRLSRASPSPPCVHREYDGPNLAAEKSLLEAQMTDEPNLALRHSPRSKLADTNTANIVEGTREMIQVVENNELASDDALLTPKVHKQSHRALRPTESTAVVTNANVLQREATPLSLRCSPEDGHSTSPSKVSLKALFQERKEENAMDLVQSFVQGSVPEASRNPHVAHGNIDRLPAHNPPLNSRHQPGPAPRSILELRIGYGTASDNTHRKRMSGRNTNDTQNFPYESPWPKAMSAQRLSPEIAPSPSCLLEYGKDGLKNAWTGYETIYGRQQRLNRSTAFNDNGVSDHNQFEYLGRSRTPDTDRSPYYSHEKEATYFVNQGKDDTQHLRQQSDEDLDDWLQDENPTHFATHQTWHNEQENLVPESRHSRVFDNSGRFSELGFEDIMAVEGLGQELGPTNAPRDKKRMGDRILRTNFSDDYHPATRGCPTSWGIRTNTNSRSTDDPSLSRFWTPHKLY